MKKAVVVSFFKSNNLGDLALSNTLDNLLRIKGYDSVKYDYMTVTSGDDINKEICFYEGINKSFVEKSNSTIIKQKVKKTLGNIVGKNTISLLKYRFDKLCMNGKWNDIEKSIKESDIFVIGGGNMLMDINPTWPDIFQEYVLLAKKYQKDIYVVYAGAGPIYSKRSKKIYNNSLGLAKKISVRDQLSKEVCESIIKDKEIIQAVDPAFFISINLVDLRLKKINNIKQDTILKIGVSVLGEMCFLSKEEHDIYLNSLFELVKSLSFALKGQVDFVLFSTEIADYNAVHKFKEMFNLAEHYKVSVVNLSKLDHVIELYKQIDFLMGGRMHGLIFAQKCTLPFIGVIWQDKIKGFGYVTNSDDRLYDISDISHKKDIIVNQIISNINNINLIKNMQSINEKLYDLVLKGM